jgi:diguanylate cyclase
MTQQKKETNDVKYANQSLALMEGHGVSPNPENYAVWFYYAMGENADLKREIDSIISNNLGFTPENNAYLYQKYIIANRTQKTMDDAAINTQKVMAEALRVINDFGGETKNYSHDLGKYVENIAEGLGQELGGNEGVRKIFKEFINATMDLRKSGEQITHKLEESTREINDLRKNLQQVTVEAQRDFLTNVFNRKTFERLIDEQMFVAQDQSSELCLLMIDVDHFKIFNDKFGHLLGDEVLKIVARVLTDTLKGRDVVARFGGEEFVVFLPDTPIEGAMRVAEMIRSAIARKELKRRDTGEIYGTITVSIGVSRYRGADDTLPTLIKRADDALYSSKHNGRNMVSKEV